jgi:uncharacterized protein (DUF433 family)
MTNSSTALREAEALLTRMSPAEKATLLQWVARDLGAFPGIASDPAVLGGEAVIVRTRIPVWALVRARQLGATDADLLRLYPTLRAEDLVNAWAYERAHRAEIEAQIAENEAD